MCPVGEAVAHLDAVDKKLAVLGVGGRWVASVHAMVRLLHALVQLDELFFQARGIERTEQDDTCVVAHCDEELYSKLPHTHGKAVPG